MFLPVTLDNIIGINSKICDVNIFCYSLLLRRECCTFSNGEYVKSGLAELELWCAEADVEVISLVSADECQRCHFHIV